MQKCFEFQNSPGLLEKMLFYFLSERAVTNRTWSHQIGIYVLFVIGSLGRKKVLVFCNIAYIHSYLTLT